LEVRCESKGIKRREDSWNGLESLLDVGFGRDKVMGALHVMHVERRLGTWQFTKKATPKRKANTKCRKPGHVAKSRMLEALNRCLV
jgi:hypothetical protein